MGNVEVLGWSECLRIEFIEATNWAYSKCLMEAQMSESVTFAFLQPKRFLL